MVHTYKVSGMTCNHCTETVKKTLESIEGIEKAEVTLDPPQAVVKMQQHIETGFMNKMLAEAGEFSLLETGGNHSVASAQGQTAEKKAFFTAYKPILLVFSYITGAAVLNETYHVSFDIMRFMHMFMGGFFLIFSFFKMLDLKGFAYSYMSYDIIANKWIGWGYVYPFIELALGLAYLFHFQITAAGIVTILVMGVSSVGVIQSLLAKKKFQCACLGTVFNLPMSNITLTEDLLMVTMSAAMFVI